ncbi:NAD(P)-dependent dehydrogenase (short-subunit alcohol dehydrogenase family) [Thalassospira sp. MBR-102]|uniref:short chain dehydrogenase n=1 Tax=Thalassospira TaxID=168934 RepID=UPI0008DE0BF9|nr:MULTISPECIES: short chain dehydrogenase [Thalassospira]MAB34596.1 short chain dehydrogenase [Thalassospira sp.]MDM7976816.1 short chain dehydrogenase [Thalassospira xiamenensis]OHY98622.1 short chain dehydrogenase [Thalassospira sp. MIT1004]RCK41693.1 short-chain dehydrogenase [Thalassospira xiamenensis]HBS20976.1 short chain dehydrogenase [Thalassospira sp.]
MKVLLVGASGIVGRGIDSELSQRHDIIRASRASGDVNVDLTDIASIRAMFEKVGKVDAVVSATGKVHFGDFAEMDDDKYRIGINDKLMGQVNLVLVGRDHVADNASFTLTTGILSKDPIRYGSSASMVNGAIESFVRAAAIEMKPGLRINAVSPGVILEAMEGYAPYFRGHDPVPAARAALGYAKSVEGLQTGQVFEIF